MTDYRLPETLLAALMQYLENRTYKEVHTAMELLSRLEVLSKKRVRKPKEKKSK